MDTPVVDVFWSFRSPWSYLATPRLVEWSRRYAVTVRLRACYPIAIRSPEFFERVHPLWFSYFARDLYRVAQFLDMPLQWPRPDPVVMDRDNGSGGPPRIASGQPYIHRLTRLGVLAEELGNGIGFADEVATVIWGGTENWHQDDHLERAAARAGLDLAELDARAIAEQERIDRVIAENESELEATGHWGVPTMAFRGEPFFGQDRLELLLWRLKQNGLRER